MSNARTLTEARSHLCSAQQEILHNAAPETYIPLSFEGQLFCVPTTYTWSSLQPQTIQNQRYNHDLLISITPRLWQLDPLLEQAGQTKQCPVVFLSPDSMINIVPYLCEMPAAAIVVAAEDFLSLHELLAKHSPDTNVDIYIIHTTTTTLHLHTVRPLQTHTLHHELHLIPGFALGSVINASIDYDQTYVMNTHDLLVATVPSPDPYQEVSLEIDAPTISPTVATDYD